ncbi:high-affinity iron transporter [Propionibacterium cyclohexanicum]|uniref:High-affinity iron transporter n=1 Tax=Propionibacterium cyclohexanicum TaxID=64702 RepID=A0A1H9RPA3_9ACTN|nr:iron uptake transporter permease EfeU [Propionibacterium cyclohexanicum]SER74781.1 high-affinity iron transporter [Propionibacterium cyclohexanicum]
MLATFIIGLREGLEAALIVSIIAAFLRRNGKSLAPMAIGVAAAVLVSLGVGVTLKVIERSLPQAAQEGMETVIGIVAVVFVTTMVLWMGRHAHELGAQLENDAQQALSSGSSRALVTMAFLAVLKEGFETAVFLLATLEAANSAGTAALGALLGVLSAAALGYGLYRGAVRVDLKRFFAVTSGFLVLVAAGLVMSVLGTAHEAGWLNAGQQHTVDLSWLSPSGSIRGALFTGVLGIPPDPRLIQVLGWFGYLVPMCVALYWPAAWRPKGRQALWLRLTLAGALAVLGVGLAVFVRPPQPPGLDTATLVDASGVTAGTVTLTPGSATIHAGSSSSSMPLGQASRESHESVPDATVHRQEFSTAPQGLPASLTVGELIALNGGRLPVGVSAQNDPGPFTAQWTRAGTRELWTAGGSILDFSQNASTTLTLSGGGLQTNRTMRVDDSRIASIAAAPGSGALRIAPADAAAAQSALARFAADRAEQRFWARTVAAILVAAALVVAAGALRAARPSSLRGARPSHLRGARPSHLRAARRSDPPAAPVGIAGPGPADDAGHASPAPRTRASHPTSATRSESSA